MTAFQPLGVDFYNRPVLEVARALLGMRLVRLLGGRRLAGRILETEAYGHEEDLGCHCRHGLTPRTRVMYGRAGVAYVYFTYGIHWLFNVVVEPEGLPAAVLVRALYPLEGVEEMATRRKAASGRRPRSAAPAGGHSRESGKQPPRFDYRALTGGPARLCQALGIDGAQNGLDLCSPGTELWIERDEEIPDSAVTMGPRVGLNTVPEPWKSIPWRFRVDPSFIGPGGTITGISTPQQRSEDHGNT